MNDNIIAPALTAPDPSAKPINGKRQDGSRTDKIPIVLAGAFNGYTGGADDNDAQANHLIWEMSHADEAVRESVDVVPTLQARMGTGGNQVPMIGVRRLTPVECERLQGFPDGWTAGQSDSTRYRQLGNAVAVPVVEWIGRNLMRVSALQQIGESVAPVGSATSSPAL